MQSKKQIDHPPITEPIADSKGMVTPLWLQWHNTLKPTLDANFSQYRMSLPQVTTSQRDKIPNLENGFTVYNNDLHEPQMYVNGAWKNLTTS